MNRIETALQALQEKKEKAFITYIRIMIRQRRSSRHRKRQERTLLNLEFRFPIRWQTVRSFRRLPMRQFSAGQIWRKHLPE